jgi:membrane-associated phospholipid phosphatase
VVVVLMLAAGLVLVVAAGVLVAGRPPAARPGTRLGDLRERAVRVRRAATAEFGVVGGFALALAFGFAVTVAIGWPLGRLAAASLPFDKSAFRWFGDHQVGWLTHAMNVLTWLGNRPVTERLDLLGGILFALLWKQRRWVPLLVMLTAFGLERQVRFLLGRTVNRFHYPQIGTYPSGGCARLVVTYGALALLYFVWRGAKASRAERVAVGTGVALLAWIEGFSRFYLDKHWFTDVIGGWIVGLLVLATVGGTLRALLDRRPAKHAAGQPALDVTQRTPDAVDAVGPVVAP